MARISLILFTFLASIAVAQTPPLFQDGFRSKGAASFGTTSVADSKAIVDMVSTAKGLLIPRMTTTQRNAIASPTTGLTVFDTTLNKFYFYQSGAWNELGSIIGGATALDASALFEADSTTKGFLGLPRMTTTQRDAISSPATGLMVYNTTTSKPNHYNGVAWKDVGSGSGGGGGVTYINSDFEADTDSWTAYADAAGTQPVDCTGGSPNVTFTRSTSTPLYDTASGVFVKDAANRQGEGIARAFTIDSGAQGKDLTVDIEYQITAGTYAGGDETTDSDVTVWAYDVTNSKIVAVEPHKVDGTISSFNYSYHGGFHSNSDSASYRLCIHVGSTSASTYTLKLDNIKVSTSKPATTSVQTSWTTYTPSFTGFGSPSNITMQWRREGSDMLVQGYWQNGTLGSTQASFTLPNNEKVASSFRDGSNVRQNFGVWYQWAGGPNYMYNVTGMAGALTNQPSNDNQVMVVARTGTGEFFNDNSGTWTGTSNWIYVNARIPIAGWQATGTVGQDAADRPIKARYYWMSDSSTTSFAHNTVSVIDFNHMDYDTCNCVTTGASWHFTAPVAGWYTVTANLILSANPEIDSDLIVIDNDVGTRAYIVQKAAASENTGVLTGAPARAYFKAGDQIHVSIFQRRSPSGTVGVNDASASNTALNFIEIAKDVDNGLIFNGTKPNVVTSSSSGAFSSGSGSFVDVTNLTATITTQGNPVRIDFIPDGGTTDTQESIVACSNTAGNTCRIFLRFLRDATDIGHTSVYQSDTGVSDVFRATPAGSMIMVDSPPAGTYTYKLQIKKDTGTLGYVNYTKMVVTEVH